LSLQFTSGKRTITTSFGSASTAYTITIDFTPPAISSTYTLTPNSTSACGTSWSNGVDAPLINQTAAYGSMPSASFYLNASATLWTLRVTQGYNGGSNYRRTGYQAGSLPSEELDQPYIVSWQAVVPMPTASGGKYPCNLFPSLSTINMAGTVISRSSGFNYYNTESWDVPIGMAAQFLSAP
jgi:hypothetical protein